MLKLRFFKQIFGIGLPFLFLTPLGARQCQAQAIAPDGSVGVNTQWEQGLLPQWYVELQGRGVYQIQAGVSREDQSLLRQGLTMYAWAFNHQAPDGSFPGCGDAFHSTCFMVLYCAQGLQYLKDYHAVTYTYDPATFASTIAKQSKQLRAAAYWLIRPDILKGGLQKDAPYTHRRYLLAAALLLTGQLTNDPVLIQAAQSHISEGLGLQLGDGWQAALTQNPDGTYPPATLVAPGSPLPAGTVQVIDALGVNPEEDGYDVNYQALDAEFAGWMFPFITDPGVRTQLIDMTSKDLAWETGRIQSNGIVDITGCRRTGVEFNRDKTLKAANYGEITDAFEQGAQLLGDPRYAVLATRVAGSQKQVIKNYQVSSDGAVNGNIDFEAGTAGSSLNIGRQAAGSYYIQAGIDREDEQLILQGLSILNWVSPYMAANGSFPLTSHRLIDTATWVEGASRAVIALSHYQPITHTLAPGAYDASLQILRQRIASATNWLSSSAALNAYWPAYASSTSSCYLMAAAFGEASSATPSFSWTTPAESFAQKGLALQQSSGANPEYGATDINAQGVGVLNACYYYSACSDNTQRQELVTMIGHALSWEKQWLNSSGAITSISKPDYIDITRAYTLGAVITAHPPFQVFANRLSVH